MFKKLSLVFLLVFFSFLISSAFVEAEWSFPRYWEQEDGTNYVKLSPDTLEAGSATDRLAKIWLKDFDTLLMTIGSVILGDLFVNGNITASGSLSSIMTNNGDESSFGGDLEIQGGDLQVDIFHEYNSGSGITMSDNLIIGESVEMKGNELILDADGDTSITADTDDRIDFNIAGDDDFRFLVNTFRVLLGSFIETDVIKPLTSGSGVTIAGLPVLNGVILSEDVIYDGTKTVEQILDNTINSGVLSAITVTDTGGLNITWTAGEIFDVNTDSVINTDAGGSVVANNDISYLIWVSGSTLTLGTAQADVPSGEIPIAHVGAQDALIVDLHEDTILNARELALSDSIASIFPVVVTEGFIVSEDTDVTNVWDVVSSAGIFYHEGHEKHEVPQIQTRVINMTRHFKTGGAWDSDTSSGIDITQYNDGSDLQGVVGAQYYKSLFIIDESTIHFVYPEAGTVLLSSAIAADLPPIPPGLSVFATSVAVVIRGSDSAFPTAGGDRWIDVRITPLTSPAGSISAHSSLSGITSDDHHNQSHAITGTSDHTANNWQIFYSNGSGEIQELALASSGQVLTARGASVAPIFAAVVAGMTSFTLAGDGGVNQTIVDGDTLTIAGGSGIATTGGATDQVSVALDINGLGADTLANADEFAFYDDTGGHTNKITWVNLMGSLSKIGTVTSGTLSTGAAIADVTMSLGSDADGDIYYRSGNKLTRLAKGAALQTLRMNVGETAPEWATSSATATFWNDDGETTVFNSATVFDISGSDVIYKFPAGKILKLTQSSPFYGVVIDSSFSTDTSVTVLAQRDIVNAAITVEFADENIEMVGYTDELTLIADSSNRMGTVRMKEDGLLLGCQVGVDVAPTGSTATFDLHSESTTSFGSKISISISANDSTYDRPSTGTGLSLGDDLSFFTDSVGSTIAGGAVRFSCWYMPQTFINST